MKMEVRASPDTKPDTKPDTSVETRERKQIAHYNLPPTVIYLFELLLTNFGQSVLMQVENITYEKSVVLVFEGTVTEEKMNKSSTLTN